MAERRLSVKSTDVLVLTGPNAQAFTHRSAQELLTTTECDLVLTLGPGETLDAVDELTMARFGWIRSKS